MSLKYDGKLIPFAKRLRKEATKQENHLWYDFLSTYKVRFQRQKVIDGYIADFYCHKVRLIIEIDGSQHFETDGQKKDAYRTQVLEGYNLKVVRFTNREIENDFRGVCEFIDLTVNNSLSR